MPRWIDSPRPVREGEELEATSLGAYLCERLPDVSGRLTVEQFPGGFSNLTYLLRFGDRELVLRRPPFGNRVKSAHDMGREFRVLDKLHPVYPPAPRPFLYCEDEDVLGAPFYVMERRRGVILRRNLPDGLEISPDLAGRLSASFIDNLATFHTLDYEAAGLADLGKVEGYVERQVTGWRERYERAKTDDWPELEQAGAWLAANMPGESARGLVHNDYKFDNLVLDPDDLTRIVAVLDWEMCTLGDPLMDLGSTLAYWVEAADDPHLRAIAFGPTDLAGSYTRNELAERYAEKTGFDVGRLTFYYVYGLFKLAVIAQQIYARYAKGFTKDERFARMNRMVGLLGRMAAVSADRDRI